MDLRQYVRAIRKFWWVVLIPALLGVSLGAVLVSRQPPRYQSTTSFFVRTVGDSSANGQFAGDQFAQRRVNSYVALLSTDRLAQSILKFTDVDLSAEQITRMISGSGDVNTVLLTATVTSTSKALATKVGNALAVQFVSLVDEVEQNRNGPTGVSIEPVSGPSVDTVPTRSALKIGLLGILGLAAGVVAAIALELRDVSIRSDEEIEEIEGGPVLTHIPADRSVRSAPLVVDDPSRHAFNEGFRRLRTNLQFLDVEHPARVLVITSSVADEGKSTTTANLALVLAAAGRQVLVIEADLHRPKVAECFQVERAVGLTDVLVGRASFEDVVQPWSSHLDVLACGHLPPNPAELVGGTAMAHLLDRLRPEYDQILIDTPPLLPLTDAAVVAAHADGAVLVVRHGKTSRHQLGRSLRSLRAVGARILGTAVTMVPATRHEGYATYDYGSTRVVEEHVPAARTTPAWVGSSKKTPAPTLPPAPEVSEKVGARNGSSPKRRKPVSKEPARAPDAPRR